MWLLNLFFGLLLLSPTKSADPQWHLLHQSDYDVKMERAHVASFNHSYFSNCKLEFAAYNRTQRVINATFTLLLDLTKNIMAHVQLYKFMSNEYRYFPITCNINVCAEINRNSFGLKDMLRTSSNILIPPKKGFYYIFTALSDHSKYPPFIPRGRYMEEVKVFHKTDFMLEIHTYIEILDKPLN